MGWEHRQRGGVYYYKSVRRDGVPRKVYVGTGPVAESLAQLDAQRRRQRQDQRHALSEEQARLAPADAALMNLRGWTDLLVRATIVLHGYHLHRGQWRRWRHDMTEQMDATTKRNPSPSECGTPSGDPAALRARLEELTARANTGDREALTELRQFLDDHPEITETVGDLTRHAEESWLDRLVDGNALVRESVRRRLVRLKNDLAGEHPATLEKLLVDEIGGCYLAQQHAEVEAAGPGGGSLAQAAFRLRRAESAQKRYLASIKTLAQLRALVPEGLVPLNSLRVYHEEREQRQPA